MPRRYNYRRNLPHIQPDNRAFFITFCTNKRWVLAESLRDIVMEVCLFGHEKLFLLHGLVVMPDHVHLVLVPFSDDDGQVSIPEIMQTIKGASAHRINRALGRKGPVWQEESFDRALRRVEAIDLKVEYIINNPVRAGLVKSSTEYRWLWTKRMNGGTCVLARAAV